MKRTYKVKFVNDRGPDVTIDVPENRSIFEIAEEEGIELPISGGAESCSSLKDKVISCTVDRAALSFLDDDQMDEGFVLTCVLADYRVKTHQEER